MNKYILLGLLSISILNFTDAQNLLPSYINKYNGKGDNSDKYNDIILDNAGDYILSGYSYNKGTNKDFLIVKLNPAGDTLWTKTINGDGNGADEVTALAVDGANNIYATGYVNGKGTGDDIMIVKLATTGDTLWTRIYNYSANQNEQPNSIAIDKLGNIIVTGQSDHDPSTVTNDDFVTLKYNPAGSELWNVRYDGLGSQTDRPVKVLTDGQNNIYVTGRSRGTIDDNFVTIKYSPLGSQLWLQTFDNGKNDLPASMAIDTSSGIYIAGRSKNTANDDYALIKYDFTGVIKWVKMYDGITGHDRPTAIVVDASSNIYVTGQSQAGGAGFIQYNFLTIKYSSLGNQIWIASYNGTASNDDVPNGIAVDGNGIVIVTGQSDVDANIANINYDWATVLYNSNGVKQWVKTFSGTSNLNDSPNSVIVDNFSNIVVAGSVINNNTQKDAVALKYNSAGTNFWNSLFNGPGDFSDKANDIAADAAGNAYVAAYSVGTGTDRDMCTIKISPAGDTLWSKIYNGSSNSIDEATSIKTDISGNVYVTGYTKNSGTKEDITTIKYNSLGDTLWVRKYNNPSSSQTDKASGLTIDNLGNVYVTGYSDIDPSAITNYDFITLKYNSVGTLLWQRMYSGTANGADKTVSIDVSASGNVYVVGQSDVDATVNTNNSIVLIKYNANGLSQWTKTYSSQFGGDVPTGAVIDPAENLFISGFSNAVNITDNDITTLAYNSSGTLLWTNLFNGTGKGNDRSAGIALDSKGNIIVTGWSDRDSLPAVNYDFATIKYNSLGNLIWIKPYNGNGKGDDIPSALVTDNNGNIYITGQSNSDSLLPNNDFLTLKYDSTGNVIWFASYNGSGNLSDGANGIAYSGNTVYVTGVCKDLTDQKEIITLKYATGTLTAIAGIMTKEAVLALYPNPCADYVNITLPNYLGPICSLIVYDYTGKEILFLPTINTNFKLDTSELTSGVYLIKLTGFNTSYTSKFIRY